MKRTILPLLLSFASVSYGTACKKDAPPAPPPAPTAAAPTPSPAPSPAPPPAPRADVSCAAPLTQAPPRELDIAGRKATLAGHRLKFATLADGDKLILGVLGPINEDSGQNLLTLGKYVRFFAQQKADAILVTGDIAETAAGIERVLSTLAESKLPVLAVIGNRECREDFVNGVSAAQKASDGIVNLNAVRVVEFPAATLVTVPGYHDPSFLGCDTGCLYHPSTVEEAATAAKEATSPVILVSHGPPLGEGSQALDRATSGGNVGDPALRRLIEEARIPFGVFSNIKEAGARAVDSAAGTSLVREGVFARSLFLNPGPADTTAWAMNDGTKSNGMAAVFVFENGQASWKPFRAKPLTTAERRRAKQLDPPPSSGKAAEPAPDGGASRPVSGQPGNPR